MKIDFEKPYDKMSWSVLAAVINAFGFLPRWVNWILECVSTNNYRGFY